MDTPNPAAPTPPPEPLAAILAEMRDYADRRAADAGGERPAVELLRSYADRIEAAAARETESLRVKAESEKRWACEYFTFARRRADALDEVCRRVSVALNCPRHADEAIALLEHDLLGIGECARAALAVEEPRHA